MEAFYDVCLEGFSLFFIGVVVLIGDEIFVRSVEGEHQAMKFTVSGDRNLEVGVAK